MRLYAKNHLFFLAFLAFIHIAQALLVYTERSLGDQRQAGTKDLLVLGPHQRQHQSQQPRRLSRLHRDIGLARVEESDASGIGASDQPFNVTRVLQERDGGARFTRYKAGIGACGGTNVDSDFIVALNQEQWDGGSHCYKTIAVTYNGKSTEAKIVDECMGCPYNALDLSNGLFQFFAPLEAGTIYGDWSFGDAPAPPATPPPPPPPPPTTSTLPRTTTSATSTTHSSVEITSATSTSQSATSQSTVTTSTASSVLPSGISIPNADNGEAGYFEQAVALFLTYTEIVLECQQAARAA